MDKTPTAIKILDEILSKYDTESDDECNDTNRKDTNNRTIEYDSRTITKRIRNGGDYDYFRIPNNKASKNLLANGLTYVVRNLPPKRRHVLEIFEQSTNKTENAH